MKPSSGTAKQGLFGMREMRASTSYLLSKGCGGGQSMLPTRPILPMSCWNNHVRTRTESWVGPISNVGEVCLIGSDYLPAVSPLRRSLNPQVTHSVANKSSEPNPKTSALLSVSAQSRSSACPLRLVVVAGGPVWSQSCCITPWTHVAVPRNKFVHGSRHTPQNQPRASCR